MIGSGEGPAVFSGHFYAGPYIANTALLSAEKEKALN